MDLSLTALLRRRAEAGSSGDRAGAGPSTSGLEALLRRRFARRVGGRFSAALLLLLAWGFLTRQAAGWLYGVERQSRDLEAQATAADQELQRLLALAQDAGAPEAPPALPQIDPAPVGGADPFSGGDAGAKAAAVPAAASVVSAGAPAAPRATAKTEAPRPPAVELVGVGGGGGRFFAVLEWAAGKTRVVQEGDLVEGWRVAAVDAQAVTLTNEAHRMVLKRRGE
ncbi:MAG TPA: hypothetical protein GXX28_08550 [Firmicutes bacterium]|nr:hypothetical protein [Bacillota bacterium]